MINKLHKQSVRERGCAYQGTLLSQCQVSYSRLRHKDRQRNQTGEAERQYRPLAIPSLALPASYIELRSSSSIGSIDKTVNYFLGIFIDL